MEPEINHQPGVMDRLVPAFVPMLLISIGYVDPGKWAATIDGGARFGFDLVVLMLFFNLAAILCQYLSARIGVVTGRNLAEICSDEYDKATCIFLGVQTELSVIALDLTMVLGIAHGLNLMLGMDLFTSVLLTAADAILFPFLATFLENYKGKFLCIFMAGFILLCYVLGVLARQPEIPLSMNGMLSKLSGESAFALMSLLGANILPHNFYLHSSIVQHHQEPHNVSKGSLCHDHFFAILSVFSGIFLMNYVLMNSAANEFYSTGLILLSFQDAMSLMDQVFRSSLVPYTFLLVLFISNQVTALNWKFAGSVVLHSFFGMDVPSWLHRAAIRTISIGLAFLCVSNSGAEGLYQMLIFTQVMVALLLPSSVIPLFRVATSRPVMGVYKISQFLEFLVLITFIGILGLNVIFVVEMMFGNSDWVGNLRWNMGSSTSVPYVVLLSSAIASLCLMLWLAATPLKSSSARLDAQVWNWDVQNIEPRLFAERKEKDFGETIYCGEESVQKREALPSLEKTLGRHPEMSVANTDLDLPETIIDPDPDSPLTTIEENCSEITFDNPPISHIEESSSTAKSVPVSTVGKEVSDVDLLDASILKAETVDPIEKTVKVEGYVLSEKDDEEVDAWEPEEISKGVSLSSQPLTSEGPGSFKSLNAKNDESGSGTGSLSRLAGLGRNARRQLAIALDDFWGQVYDFHGQLTHEAKAKKLDVLLGVDSKHTTSSLKVDTSGKEFAGYFPSVGGRGSDSLMNSSLYDSTKQQMVQSGMESSYGTQRGPSASWSNQIQSFDAYMHNSTRNVVDSGERRYVSLRLPPSSDGRDHQPKTVHGYQMSAYLNKQANDRNADYLNGQMEMPPQKSLASAPTNFRDPLAFTLGQKPLNGLTSVQASGFQNLAMSRNSSLQSERSYYDVYSSAAAANLGTPANTKKYYSLPDISGISASHRDSGVSERSAQWDNPIGFGPSTGRTSYEPSLYPNTGSRIGAPLAFDELSPSKVYKDAFSLQLSSGPDTRSLWSRQPYEQFGVADKPRNIGGEGIGSGINSITQEATSVVDMEVKLLQSFRQCILKLLKLEGSDWLFKQNDGADEDLVDRVAAREKFLYEVETREMHWEGYADESQYSSSGRKSGAPRNDEAGFTKLLVSSVPHCGEGCVWRVDLIISFGVWCIHRILDLSLMESRPELWGKYTYVLNRLQGIVDLAFSKPRSPSTPCFCLQVPITHQQRSSPPVSNGMLPPAAKPGRGKCTTAATLLDMVKDVEIAISCRKGRTGTAAGDIAFPKGKENLASVLKRYKRRLSNKSTKVSISTAYGS